MSRAHKKSAKHRNIVFETEAERTQIMLATHWTFKRFKLLTALIVGAMTAASVVQSHAKAVGNLTDWPCCAVSTKGIEIAQGQTARFELKNTDDESVAVHLQFVDKKGKALQQRDATIKPGNTEEVTYAANFSGGVFNRSRYEPSSALKKQDQSACCSRRS